MFSLTLDCSSEDPGVDGRIILKWVDTFWETGMYLLYRTLRLRGSVLSLSYLSLTRQSIFVLFLGYESGTTFIANICGN